MQNPSAKHFLMKKERKKYLIFGRYDTSKWVNHIL